MTDLTLLRVLWFSLGSTLAAPLIRVMLWSTALEAGGNSHSSGNAEWWSLSGCPLSHRSVLRCSWSTYWQDWTEWGLHRDNKLCNSIHSLLHRKLLVFYIVPGVPTKLILASSLKAECVLMEPGIYINTVAVAIDQRNCTLLADDSEKCPLWI